MCDRKFPNDKNPGAAVVLRGLRLMPQSIVHIEVKNINGMISNLYKEL